MPETKPCAKQAPFHPAAYNSRLYTPILRQLVSLIKRWFFGTYPISCLKTPYYIIVPKALAHTIYLSCKIPDENRYLLLSLFFRSFHILIYWQEIILMLFYYIMDLSLFSWLHTRVGVTRNKVTPTWAWGFEESESDEDIGTAGTLCWP